MARQRFSENGAEPTTKCGKVVFFVYSLCSKWKCFSKIFVHISYAFECGRKLIVQGWERLIPFLFKYNYIKHYLKIPSGY